MKLQSVSLKRSDHLDEKWVQQQIAEDPTLLGLGDLVVRDKERIQANAGRLDLLLQDPESLKRFEVEIQLGETDESHIIRTIEYWDIERKRYPQYEHCAVIIAEEITSRFLNVIQLFNGAIPLIALKMTAYQVGAEYALTFVKVLDELIYGLVDDDEPVAEPTDRTFWETIRGSKRTVGVVDALLKMVNTVEPKAILKYNKRKRVAEAYCGAPAGMLSAAAPFDFRQHLVDHGIVREGLPEGGIQPRQQIGDRLIVAAHEGNAYFFSLRGQRGTADRGYLTNRDLTARVIEESLDMFECRDGGKGIFHQAANAVVTCVG